MTYKDVISFVKDNQIFSIATIDGDQPRVRAFLAIFFEGDDRIYFTTGTTKNVYKQFKKNPKVELCFYNQEFKMLRITSQVEEIDDRAKKQKLIDERDYLKGFTADDPRFILMRLPHGEAWFWTLPDNFKEEQLERIKF